MHTCDTSQHVNTKTTSNKEEILTLVTFMKCCKFTVAVIGVNGRASARVSCSVLVRAIDCITKIVLIIADHMSYSRVCIVSSIVSCFSLSGELEC